MIKSPCVYCEDRYPACHGKCVTYKEWKEEIQAAKKSLTKGYAVDSFTIVNAEKIKKRRRKKT